ncbi:MAG TPA: hypothetical protein VKN14_13165, partial [Flavobacteriaceae bacterium]|nr:hypothetical protein [Flavobacteriaceae bacterium]
MKDLTNKLYRNHSLAYKLLLFVSTTFLIVYLFPKSGKFKYSFEKGKPWQSENLYAPFNFAIKKTQGEIDSEKETISNNAFLYFNLNSDVKSRVEADYRDALKEINTDSISSSDFESITNTGIQIINELYEYGFSSENYNFEEERNVIILEDRVEKLRTTYSNLVNQEDLTSILNKALRNNNLSQYRNLFISLFYDIVEPN